MTKDEEAPAPEVNGHAEEVEEKEDVKSEKVKEKEAESHSNATADTEVLSLLSPRLAVSRSAVHQFNQHKEKTWQPNKLVCRPSKRTQYSLVLCMLYMIGPVRFCGE